MFELLQNLIFYIWIQDNVWENIEEGGDIEIDIIEMRVVALFEYKDVMGHAVKSIFAVAEVWINLISILFSGMLYYQRFSLLTFFTQGNGEFGMTKIIWYIMLNKWTLVSYLFKAIFFGSNWPYGSSRWGGPYNCASSLHWNGLREKIHRCNSSRTRGKVMSGYL